MNEVFSSKSCFVCLAVLAVTLLSRPAQAQDPHATFEDTRIDAAEFAIFPWDTPKGTKESYEELRECGFNMSGFTRPESLDAAHAAGLKSWVANPKIIQVRGGEGLSDEEVLKRVQSIVQPTRDHPAVIGYHVVDEPPNALFPQVARWVNAFHDQAPDKIAFVNLFPNYSQNVARDTSDNYHKYIQSFVDAVKPKVLSYDHYALFKDGTMRPAYFPNLETGRYLSQKNNLPFFHVILGNTHFNYADPSPEWFRFQVYTSLAYGVSGIAWFTYIDRERGNYRDAAIDLYGRRTPTWAMLRDVNLVCHRLAPTLTKMKSVNVFHHPEPPKGCLGLGDSRFLKDVKGKGPFVVGEFEAEGGKRAVLIVNKNLADSTHFEVNPKDGPKDLYKVSSTTAEILPMSAEQDWLAPGEGMLLLLDHEAK